MYEIYGFYRVIKNGSYVKEDQDVEIILKNKNKIIINMLVKRLTKKCFKKIT